MVWELLVFALCLVEDFVKITRVVEGNNTMHPPTVREKD